MGQHLNKKNIADVVALTPMQEGILFHYLADSKSDEYFEQLHLELSGPIDINIFTITWNFIAETNETLKTVYRWQKIDKPVQIVLKERNVQIEFYDLSEEDQPVEVFYKIKAEDREKKFDLREVPFRVALCKISELRYTMLISNHHILVDGWSTGIILKEFFTVYDDFQSGREPKKITKSKFSQFVKLLKNDDRLETEKYWREYLKDLECKPMPKMNLVDEERKNGINTYSLSISSELSEEITDFTRVHKITLASLLYSAWGILLSRYTTSDDVLFCATFSGRDVRIQDIEEMVGLFINTLPLRIQTGPVTQVLHLLKEVNQSLQTMSGYTNTSLVDIKSYCGIHNSADFTNSLVVIENYPLVAGNSQNLKVESYSMFEQTNFDLTLSITTFGELELHFSYKLDQYSDKVIEKMACHLANILSTLVNQPEQLVKEVKILSTEEEQHLLFDLNNSDCQFPAYKAIHELLEEQVEKQPDLPAIVWAEGEMSYGKLNAQANKLARILRTKGVQPDSIVGILTERSPEMLVGIFAILKAGGVYLPLDPTYPKERLGYIFKDSGAQLLLKGIDLDLTLDTNILNIELDGSVSAEEGVNLPLVNQPSDLAYIIYTSGSTGKPKGVMVEHRNVLNTVLALQEKFLLLTGDTFLLKTNYTFDVSVAEIFGWFLGHGRLAILAKGVEKDPKSILQAIYQYQVTHINFTPSMLRIFLNILDEANLHLLTNVRYIISAGEALSGELVDQVKSLQCNFQLENNYGPTEATIYATNCSVLSLENTSIVPIGKPLANMKVYILDEDQRLLPEGVPGELCIGGSGVARGYLNRPEMNRDRFIRSPFNSEGMIYRTGDLARWLPNGEIEYLGRIDQQVKIRGYRIEPGEIESQLLKHSHIKAVAVVAREDHLGEKYLAAYYVTDDILPASELNEYLAAILPEYMIPTYFIQIEKLPLTSSGKLQRKGLPDPVAKVQDGTEYVAPQTEVEEILVGFFEEILGTTGKIGIHDNFITLGGHSLRTATLMAKVHKELDVEIPLQEIFKNPTVKGIADYIQNAQKFIFERIELVQTLEYYLSRLHKKDSIF